MGPQELLENRRRAVLAAAILWGNAHYRRDVGVATSSDGHGYTLNNVYYATALLEAAAEGFDVQLSRADATARGNAILGRLFAHRAPAEHVIPRHSGPGAPSLPAPVAARLLLPPLAYLELHRQRLHISTDAATVIHRIVTILLRDGASMWDRRAPASPQRGPARTATAAARHAAGLTIERLLEQPSRKVGVDVHWSALLPATVFPEAAPAAGGPTHWPIPRAVCQAPFTTPCTTIRCAIPCLPFDPASIDHCPTWADACATSHVDVEFFKGARSFSLGPAIFVGGWEPQVHAPHPGGFGFGDETWYSTLEPSHTPAGTGTHCGYTAWPPLENAELATSDKAKFYGLATMLRCGAGYDHVRWSQSHPSGPIQDAVNELAAVVQKTKEMYQVDKVVFVCHSRGGLVARKYILNRWRLCGDVDVEKIITYGTPHLGAELAYLAADTMVEIFTTDIVWVLIDLILGTPSSPVVDLLELVALISPQLKHDLEAKFLESVWPIVDFLSGHYLDNYLGFVASGDELRPDSTFITELNEGYASAEVPIKGGQIVPLWQAIPHVLIAGTSPDYLTLYFGDWLSDLTALGIATALAPIGVCTERVGPLAFPAPEYQWTWTWFPILRVLGDVTPSIAALAALPTFREGEGDSVVDRSSALAAGIDGTITRAEFALNHFTLKVNSEQQTPFYDYSVNPWQLLFLELLIENISTPSTGCRALSECQGFSFQQAL